jgi:hypothetical protein
MGENDADLPALNRAGIGRRLPGQDNRRRDGTRRQSLHRVLGAGNRFAGHAFAAIIDSGRPPSAASFARSPEGEVIVTTRARN